MALYARTSEMSSSPWLYYNDISIKVAIAIPYFLMPRTVIFLSSPWHTHLHTTIQICVLYVDLTHSCLSYSLYSTTPTKYTFSSWLSGNRVITTRTLTLIGRETSLISGNQVVVTPKHNFNKETQWNWKMLFGPFLSLPCIRIISITIPQETSWYTGTFLTIILR